MATEQAAMSVNGNYANQPPSYGMPDQSYTSHTNGNSISTNAEYGASPSTGNSAAGGGGAPEVPKDEVGWYFVEQYYTTLSRSPEKLFLFYNKRSQYVSGLETEKVPVCVGQKAINNHIKEQDIQDCKVRVTNVDSQASGQNIVIQVIGEMSNRSQPQRKFTQTFVLAEQTNGYFVLNDMLRYMVDEEEEINGDEVRKATTETAGGFQESVATVAEAHAVSEDEAAPHGLTSSDNHAAQEHDAEVVNQELEEVIKENSDVEDKLLVIVNGNDVSSGPELGHTEEAPVAVVPTEASAPTPEDDDVKPEGLTQSETPKEPEPSPIRPSPDVTVVQPATSAQSLPAAPKTWANMVAGDKVATPINPPVHTVPSTAPTVASPPKAAPSAQSSVQPISAAPATAPAISPEAERTSVPQSIGSEWQSVGHDHKKNQGRPQPNQGPLENTRAYIKNVTDDIDGDALKAQLQKFGEVLFFDINRQKNCAFVEFGTAVAYQAAVAANPHDIAGHRIYVEERRMNKPGYNNNFGPGRAGGFRGGRGGPDGRPAGQGRGGFQKDGGRGGFPNRGRGNYSPRGRGVPQPA